MEEFPYVLHPNDMFYNKCSTSIKEIGFVKVHDEIEYIPTRAQAIRYMQQACGHPSCKHTVKPFIKKAAISMSVLNHSLTSSSSVSYVMYQWYVNSVSLYCQKKGWEQVAIALS